MQLLSFTPIELPEPLVNDFELTSIGKIAAQGKQFKAGIRLEDNPTEILAGDYSS